MQLKWSGKKVRETFIQFFVEKCGHTFYKSCGVVPFEDPTLLFINAGQVDPSNPMAKLQRACNTQKCIRAGGKHNDLDDVGKDVYHHTFFEMLGNWSFGDYFKKEAISWSWELLTKVYHLDPDRLYATYFGGDSSQGLPADEESRSLWLQYLPSNRVLPFGCKDNFWEMGDVGPCGPCTEIHYDRIGSRDASSLVNADVPDVIEIWNNVFIQFNRLDNRQLVVLPSQHVDTGMGFERLTSILQEKDSNYDTDIFQPLFSAIEKITGALPYGGKVGKDDVSGRDMAYRVIADHARTLTIAITDGAIPSNDGRGYVLRRILRRAVRYGAQFLDAKCGFLSQLVPVVVDLLGEPFPELEDKLKFVQEIVLEEEISFGKTLTKGIARFRKTALALKESGHSILSGEDAFFLYDSMGFPIDLTQLMAEELGLTVDMEGYQLKMKDQVERSKSDRKAAGGQANLILEANETEYLKDKGIAPTFDQPKFDWFKNPSAKIVAIFTNEGFVESTTSINKSHIVAIILDTTSFYSQSGGQINDTGFLTAIDGSLNMRVEGVESYAGYVVHLGFVQDGAAQVGKELFCKVDYDRRSKIAPNHTMTHVLNHALRKVLSSPSDQRGSLVDETRLRFDFTINKALKIDEIKKIEDICRDTITNDLPVYTKAIPLTQAKEIHGLRAVFGETYPDIVRVVSIGQQIDQMLEDPKNSSWENYSVEFCGGTHLKNTKQAKSFVLYEESAIAKGIRRISAMTGEMAEKAEEKAAQLHSQMDKVLLLQGNELASAVVEMTSSIDESQISLPQKAALRLKLSECSERVKKFRKEEAAARMASGVSDAAKVAEVAKEKGEGFALVNLLVGTDAKLGREMIDAMRLAYPEGSLMIFSRDLDKKKTACFCSIAENHHLKGLDAKEWVNAALEPINGKGGGKDPMNATGQAKTTEGIESCVDSAAKYFSNLNLH